MTKPFSICLLAILLLFATSCEKEGKEQGEACNSLPHNAAPAELVGGYASGFSSFSQLVDIYTGKVTGPSWQSGKFFRFTQNGQGAEFYYTAQSQYSYVATKASGTIAFDEGSDANSGSFVFHACSGHYRGWGSLTVDRDATAEELQNSLTHRYYYRMEGNWLRIDPSGEPDAYSSSFERVD